MQDTVKSNADGVANLWTPEDTPGVMPGRERVSSNSPTSRVWIRAGLLFLVLCLIKCAILFTFRKHLFEIHWRVSATPPSWRDNLFFIVFAGLAGIDLWLLGRRCVAIGTAAVRTANACVLVIGAVFIFLSFSQLDLNYLQPILNGTLKWRNIGAYMAVNLFFGRPFLGYWIGAYIFLYYIFARTKREKTVLYLTAISATAYILFCLRVLKEYGTPLMFADCVGIAGLFAIRRPERSLRAGFVLAPLACMSVGFFLFRRYTEALASPGSGFYVVLIATTVLFGAAALLGWRYKFWTAWSWMFPFAFSSFVLLLTTSFPVAGNFRHLLEWGLALPHYFLGELVICLGLAAISYGVVKLRPSTSLWWLDATGLLVIALAFVDLRLSQIMGMRLDWQVIAFGDDPKMMWRLARPFLPAAAALFVCLVALYFAAIWAVTRYGRRFDSSGRVVGPGGRFLAIFALLGVAGWRFVNPDKVEGQSAVQLVATSPLWKKACPAILDERTFAEQAGALGMESLVHPPAAAPVTGAARDWNVVLIFQESTYNKFLSLFDGTEDTQPLLSKYKDRMEVFPNFYSDFAGSIHARFATFTGLYPIRDFNQFTLNRVDVKSVFDILSTSGYHCSLFYSSFVDYTGFRDFLRGRGLEHIYDADTMPSQRHSTPVSWGLQEEETLQAIQDHIRDSAAKKSRFFLTYVPAAPHNPFDGTPKRFRKYHGNIMGDYTQLYLNELLYMDWAIASILDQLKESGVLDHTLVIITADHGEMLGENGGPAGHGWAITPVLQNVPLIILDPSHPGYTVNPTVGSQVDLLPTLLDRLGVVRPAGQLYQGVSLDSPAAREHRRIYINSFRQYGIIDGREFICGDRDTEAKNIADSPHTVFEFANAGAQTSFFETNTPLPAPISIRSFDDFQANFLLHYADYCKRQFPGETAHR